MSRLINYFKQLKVAEATRFLVIFYVVGITGFLVPFTRNIFEWMIPLSLCVNFFMLFLFHRPYDKKHLFFFSSVVVFSFAVEALGVNTGLVFGEYVYGRSLAVKLFETPILIGFNWLMLTYGVVQLFRVYPLLRKYSIVLGALLMVIFDFVMEPVAMKTGMWSWGFNNVPLQNYWAWFVVAALIIAGFELLKIKTDNKIGGRIFLFQFFFFLILNIFLK